MTVGFDLILHPSDWQPMDTFPRDGTRCDILCKHGSIARKVWWGAVPMGNEMAIIGENNRLSPWLELTGWRKHVPNT